MTAVLQPGSRSTAWMEGGSNDWSIRRLDSPLGRQADWDVVSDRAAGNCSPRHNTGEVPAESLGEILPRLLKARGLTNGL